MATAMSPEAGRAPRAPESRRQAACHRVASIAQVDAPVGGLHGDRLERGDRVPELLPLPGAVARHAQDAFAEAEGQGAGAGGQQAAQPLRGAIGGDDVPAGDARRVEAQFAEALAGGGDLLGERGSLVSARDQREDGPVVPGVRGHEDEVGSVRPRDRCPHPVQHPLRAVLPGGHCEFGGIVAGGRPCAATVRTVSPRPARARSADFASGTP
ncbi:hypothetical protein RKD18_004361 [Streptomyces phaeoluteigriseus]